MQRTIIDRLVGADDLNQALKNEGLGPEEVEQALLAEPLTEIGLRLLFNLYRGRSEPAKFVLLYQDRFEELEQAGLMGLVADLLTELGRSRARTTKAVYQANLDLLAVHDQRLDRLLRETESDPPPWLEAYVLDGVAVFRAGQYWQVYRLSREGSGEIVGQWRQDSQPVGIIGCGAFSFFEAIVRSIPQVKEYWTGTEHYLLAPLNDLARWLCLVDLGEVFEPAFRLFFYGFEEIDGPFRQEVPGEDRVSVWNCPEQLLREIQRAIAEGREDATRFREKLASLYPENYLARLRSEPPPKQMRVAILTDPGQDPQAPALLGLVDGFDQLGCAARVFNPEGRGLIPRPGAMLRGLVDFEPHLFLVWERTRSELEWLPPGAPLATFFSTPKRAERPLPDSDLGEPDLYLASDLATKQAFEEAHREAAKLVAILPPLVGPGLILETEPEFEHDLLLLADLDLEDWMIPLLEGGDLPEDPDLDRICLQAMVAREYAHLAETWSKSWIMNQVLERAIKTAGAKLGTDDRVRLLEDDFGESAFRLAALVRPVLALVRAGHQPALLGRGWDRLAETAPLALGDPADPGHFDRLARTARITLVLDPLKTVTPETIRAMLAGSLVMTADKGGQDRAPLEMFLPRRELVARFKDEADLVAKVARYLDHGQARLELARAGRQATRGGLTPRTVADRMLALLLLKRWEAPA